MDLTYGGEDSYFSSLRANEAESAILNLEKGHPGVRWGRLILYVADVDDLWTHLKETSLTGNCRAMVRGVNAIFTCQIRTGTSCRLRGRCDERYTWLAEDHYGRFSGDAQHR
jgi:hypothetical protein